MHWVLLGLGAAGVALAAVLKLVGGVSDFQQHALPFWLFIIGVSGLFAGGWFRDKAIGTVSHAAAGLAASVATLAPAVAPQLAPAISGGLSSLQRHAAAVPTAALATAAAPTSMLTIPTAPTGMLATAAAPTAMLATEVASAVMAPADIMARIHALEAENNMLRAVLNEANSSVSRGERRDSIDRRQTAG
jgi:hypothetical protein